MTDSLPAVSPRIGVNQTETRSRVQASADAYRKAVDDDVIGALIRVDRFYRNLNTTLQGSLHAVEQMIRERLDAGQDVPVSWLHKQTRYRDLLNQAQLQGSQYGSRLAGETRDIVDRTFRQGQKDAIALMEQSIPGYSNIAPFNRLPEGAVEQFIGASQYQSYAIGTNPLSELFDSYGPDNRKVVERSISEGLAMGLHPDQITAKVNADSTGTMIPRAATVVRTETYRAYREANRQSYLANDDVVPSWTWNAYIGDYTCAACIAMHGQEFPSDTPMGTHPNCRCTMVPKTLSWAELGFEGLEEYEVDPGPTGPQLFDNMSDEQKRRILGPGKYDLYRKGEAELPDMVAVRKTDRWGTTRSVASLQQTRENATVRQARERIALDKTGTKKRTWNQKIEDRRDAGIHNEADVRELGAMYRKDRLSKVVTKDAAKLSKERKTLRAEQLANREEIAQIGSSMDRTRRDRLIQIQARQKDLDRRLGEIDYELSHTPLSVADKRTYADLRKKQAQAEKDATDLYDRSYDAATHDEMTRLQGESADASMRAITYQRDADAIARSRKPIDLSETVLEDLRKVRRVGVDEAHTVRDYEPSLSNVSYKRTSDYNDKDVQGIFERAADVYPTDWMNRSARADDLIFGKSPRGYHGKRYDYTEIVTSPSRGDDGYQTMVHEVGHRVEATYPRVVELERQFYERRVGQDPLVHMGSGYGPNEVTRPDDFFSPYIGKDYGGSAYEIVSMGFEAVLVQNAVSLGGRAILSDLDHLDFILGLLFGV